MQLKLNRTFRNSLHARDGWSVALPGFAQDVSWSPDSTALAVATLAGPVLLYKATDGLKLAEDRGHAQGALKVACSPAGDRIISSGQDGALVSWSLKDGPRARRRGGGRWVDAIAWSERGSELASAAGHVVRVWTPELELLVELQGYERAVHGLHWRPGAAQLVVLAGTRVSFVDLTSSGTAQVLEREQEILRMCMDPAGRQIATSLGGGSLHVWNLDTQRDLKMTGYRSAVRAMAWSPDGELLATGCKGDIAVWSVASQQVTRRPPSMLLGHSGVVTGLAFVADGPRLISCDDAGAVASWSWLGGRFYLDWMRRLGSPLSSLSVSPDGTRAGVALANGELRCWLV